MAYGFNEDRSKAPVYTKGEIDSMELAQQADVDAKDAATNQRIDTMIESGSPTIEGRDVLWTGSATTDDIALSGNAGDYDCLEVHYYIDSDAAINKRIERVPVTGGRLGALQASYTDASNSQVSGSSVALSVVAGTSISISGNAKAQVIESSGTIDMQGAASPLTITAVYGVKFASAAELTDIRVGYDSAVYPTAGGAVRYQAKGTINPPLNLTWVNATPGYCVSTVSGYAQRDATTYADYYTCDIVPLPEYAESVEIETFVSVTANSIMVAFFGDVDNVYQAVPISTTNWPNPATPIASVPIPDGAKYMVINHIQAHGANKPKARLKTPLYQSVAKKDTDIDGFSRKIADAVLERSISDLYSDSAINYDAHNTSVFSGWCTDFTADADMHFDGFLMPVKARGTAITEYTAYVGKNAHGNDGEFFKKLIKLNVPAYKTTMLDIPFSIDLEQGDTVCIGYACNQLCDGGFCLTQNASNVSFYARDGAYRGGTKGFQNGAKEYHVLYGYTYDYSQRNDDVELYLPEKYDLVVNDTFELFHLGIVNSAVMEPGFIKISCGIGSNYKNRFIAKATESGNNVLNASLIDAAGNVIGKASTTLVAHAVPQSPATQKNVLCVGDSLTVHGQWVKEFKRRVTASGGTPAGANLSNVNFIGTMQVDGANFEAAGGRSFESYNTNSTGVSAKSITCTHDKTEAEDQHSIYKDSVNNEWLLETIEAGSIRILLTSGNGNTFPATGTLTWVSGGVNHADIVYTASSNAVANPFWDVDANAVDFESYASGLGVSAIDYVFVLLGWNMTSWNGLKTVTQINTFIDNVHSDFPNAQIVLMGLEVPSLDGLAANYGANRGVLSYYDESVSHVFALDKVYRDIAEATENVSYVNVSGQFDTEHNMMTSTRTVNTRNSEMETYQSNGVHPADSGYLQIADAAYRVFVGLLNN